MKTISRYATLLLFFFRSSLIADLEYRLNFAVRIVTDILWYSSQIVVFEVLFRHTHAIGGWSLEESRFFLGVLFFIDSLWMVLFSENFDRFSEKVRKGDLDFLLAKPVNSQFMATCQRMAPAFLVNTVLGFIYMLWAFSNLPGERSAVNLLWLIVFLPCALAVCYSTRFLFATTSLIITRADSFQYIWYQLYRLGTRPDSMFPLWMRYVVLSILPMAFIASVPATAVLRGPSAGMVVSAFVVMTAVLAALQWYWNFALKRYTSASS